MAPSKAERACTAVSSCSPDNYAVGAKNCGHHMRPPLCCNRLLTAVLCCSTLNTKVVCAQDCKESLLKTAQTCGEEEGAAKSTLCKLRNHTYVLLHNALPTPRIEGPPNGSAVPLSCAGLPRLAMSITLTTAARVFRSDQPLSLTG